MNVVLSLLISSIYQKLTLHVNNAPKAFLMCILIGLESKNVYDFMLITYNTRNGVINRQYNNGLSSPRVGRSLQCADQRNFNALENVANALRNVANALGNVDNALGNNINALETFSNALKYVATRFQCILKCVFNAFSDYLLCQVFANRVTNGDMYSIYTF